jgi:hypothetical protein
MRRHNHRQPDSGQPLMLLMMLALRPATRPRWPIPVATAWSHQRGERHDLPASQQPGSRTGRAVAVDSLQAMSFRTAVWMAIFLATAWMVRRHADD